MDFSTSSRPWQQPFGQKNFLQELPLLRLLTVYLRLLTVYLSLLSQGACNRHALFLAPREAAGGLVGKALHGHGCQSGVRCLLRSLLTQRLAAGGQLSASGMYQKPKWRGV